MSAPNDGEHQNEEKRHFPERLGTGQQDRPCRACVDAESWIKLYGSKKRKLKTENNTNTNNATAPASLSEAQHRECPLDKDELGRRTWSFLHTMAAYYPDQPSSQQQQDMKDMMRLFSRFYPCDFCAKDFRKSMKNNEPDTSSQTGFSQWLCKMHNQVNLKLGKPEFDCSLVNQRWRDGWNDGTCD